MANGRQLFEEQAAAEGTSEFLSIGGLTDVGPDHTSSHCMRIAGHYVGGKVEAWCLLRLTRLSLSLS